MIGTVATLATAVVAVGAAAFAGAVVAVVVVDAHRTRPPSDSSSPPGRHDWDVCSS